ncbi:MAG: hypothetical protein ABL953_11460 [Ilumatobacteraceae bacterium]
MKLRRIIAAAAFVVAGTACEGGDESSDLTPLGAPFICDEPIDVLQEVPETYVSVADVVALPGDGEVLQRGRTGTDYDPESLYTFSKMGLLIRPGATFQIHVAPDSLGNALIEWNIEDEHLVGSIAVSSCPGDPSVWLAYPGGVWTLEPACVELIVITADATGTIRLPVGVAC